jgi:HAD superfamily hydrolase (TIGR01549 family)
MDYDAIIFDNDGVLVTPTPRSLWQSASRLAFQELGVCCVVDEHVERMDGHSLSALVRLCDRYGVNAWEFWRRREAHAARAQRHEFRRGAKGAYDDIGAVSELSVPVGIVSNNQQATVDFVVDYCGLGETVDTYYGREPTLDGLARMKPGSYYLREAVDDLGATNPLYVGDSSVDIAAADDLGIDSAFVRRPHRTDYETATDPTYEITSLTELQILCDTGVRSRSTPKRGRGSH